MLEQLPPEIQEGHYMVLGPTSTSLFMGSVDKNTVIWALTSLAPKSRASELNALFQDPAAAQVNFQNIVNRQPLSYPYVSEASCLQEFLEHEVPKIAEDGGFSGEPLLAKILRQTETSTLKAFPTIDKFPHAAKDDGVAYIGDAWHPMSPFAGAGANMALQDAWELAQQLVNGGHSNAQAAVAAFAAQNAQRSVDAVKGNRRNVALAHSSGWKKYLLVTALRAVGSFMRLTGLPRLAVQGDLQK